MKRVILITLYLFISSVSIWSDEGKTLLAQQYYNNENYQEAQKIYEQLLLINPASSELNYNLANTYYHQNKLGKAKYYYKSSLKSHPRDADTHHNLKILNLKLIDTINEPMSLGALFKRMISSFTSSELLIVISILLIILNGAVFIWLKLNKDYAKGVTLIVSFAIVITSISLSVKQNISIQTGIIITEKVAIKSGPLKSFDTLFYLHDGTEFAVLNTNEYWTKIKLSNGLVGWAHNSSYWSH